MKRIVKILSAAIVVLLTLTACIPSLNPLSEKNDVTKKELPGVWKSGDNFYIVSEKGGEYFAKCGGVTYKLRLTELNGDTFASIAVAEAPALNGDGLFPFLIGAWSIYRVDLKEDTLVLSWIEGIDNVVKDCTGADGGMMIVQSKDQPPLMVSSPEVLRKWISEHTLLYLPKTASRNSMTFHRMVEAESSAE